MAEGYQAWGLLVEQALATQNTWYESKVIAGLTWMRGLLVKIMCTANGVVDIISIDPDGREAVCASVTWLGQSPSWVNVNLASVCGAGYSFKVRVKQTSSVTAVALTLAAEAVAPATPLSTGV